MLAGIKRSAHHEVGEVLPVKFLVPMAPSDRSDLLYNTYCAKELFPIFAFPRDHFNMGRRFCSTLRLEQLELRRRHCIVCKLERQILIY